MKLKYPQKKTWKLNIAPEIHSAWKTSLSFWEDVTFRGELLNFGGVSIFGSSWTAPLFAEPYPSKSRPF